MDQKQQKNTTKKKDYSHGLPISASRSIQELGIQA